jgi:putative flippase GtrA
MYGAHALLVARLRPTRQHGCAILNAVGRYRRLAGWFVIGATAALLELGLLRVLYETLAWPLPIATAIAAEVLILGKFITTDRLVFGHASPTINRLLRYHGASAGALVVYWLVINALAELSGVPYIAAFVVGTAAAFAWSLVTNFLWVWAQPARS